MENGGEECGEGGWMSPYTQSTITVTGGGGGGGGGAVNKPKVQAGTVKGHRN